MSLEVILSGIIAALVAIAGAFGVGHMRGTKTTKTKQAAKEANEYVEARKRADEADRNAGSGEWADRLRKHRDQ